MRNKLLFNCLLLPAYLLADNDSGIIYSQDIKGDVLVLDDETLSALKTTPSLPNEIATQPVLDEKEADSSTIKSVYLKVGANYINSDTRFPERVTSKGGLVGIGLDLGSFSVEGEFAHGSHEENQNIGGVNADTHYQYNYAGLYLRRDISIDSQFTPYARVGIAVHSSDVKASPSYNLEPDPEYLGLAFGGGLQIKLDEQHSVETHLTYAPTSNNNQDDFWLFGLNYRFDIHNPAQH